jgi:hypothetical protein
MTRLGEILESAEVLDRDAWLYLPQREEWRVDSQAAVLRSEEVPPELEDEPEAGVPQAAKDAGLMQVLPVSVLQEIVRNAREQRPGVSTAILFDAFLYYYDNDAFLTLT